MKVNNKVVWTLSSHVKIVISRPDYMNVQNNTMIQQPAIDLGNVYQVPKDLNIALSSLNTNSVNWQQRYQQDPPLPYFCCIPGQYVDIVQSPLYSCFLCSIVEWFALVQFPHNWMSTEQH